MDTAEARKIVGNRPDWELKNMATALSLHSWSNTEEEWKRMRAAVVVLGRKAPKKARELIREHFRGEHLPQWMKDPAPLARKLREEEEKS